jgi:hypothetical protein
MSSGVIAAPMSAVHERILAALLARPLYRQRDTTWRRWDGTGERFGGLFVQGVIDRGFAAFGVNPRDGRVKQEQVVVTPAGKLEFMRCGTAQQLSA